MGGNGFDNVHGIGLRCCVGNPESQAWSDRGPRLRWAKEGVYDWDKSASINVGATPRRSTSSLGVMVHLRAFTVAIILFCALVACQEGKRSIVRVEVFEDHVSVDGARSDLPIQQAVDAQRQNRKVHVVLIAQQPLSAARVHELTLAVNRLYPGIGIRRVQFECLTSPGSTCR